MTPELQSSLTKQADAIELASLEILTIDEDIETTRFIKDILDRKENFDRLCRLLMN